MTLQELFDQFKHGELSQISIGGQAAGVIDENNWHMLIPHVNLGLTTLFKRFSLKKGSLKLVLQADQYVYPLSSKHSMRNSLVTGLPKFIDDRAGEQFKDDILKVERVVGDSGAEFVLDDPADEYSVLMSSMTSLSVPSAIVAKAADLPECYKTDALQVHYRANHPKIVMSAMGWDPNRVDVELPYSHLEALLWFMASRVNNPIGMGQEFNAGNIYYAKFEAECAKLEGLSLELNEGFGEDKLRGRGFV